MEEIRQVCLFCGLICFLSIQKKNLNSSLISLLHAQTIIDNDTSTSLFTKTIQDHKVCVLVKMLDGFYTVDIKCSDKAIGEALIAEINDFWK